MIMLARREARMYITGMYDAKVPDAFSAPGASGSKNPDKLKRTLITL